MPLAEGNVFNFQTISHLPVAVNDTTSSLLKQQPGFGHRIHMADIVFSATSRSDYPRAMQTAQKFTPPAQVAPGYPRTSGLRPVMAGN